MDLQPIAIETEVAAIPVGAAPDFTVQLPVFEGPLQLLLHLIESRQLDILTVPLAELADGYVTHLAVTPSTPANLAEFVAIAAQLIYLKSRRLLPNEPLPVGRDDDDEPSEEELRRRLLEYRALRDAAAPARHDRPRRAGDAPRAARERPAGRRTGRRPAGRAARRRARPRWRSSPSRWSHRRR